MRGAIRIVALGIAVVTVSACTPPAVEEHGAEPITIPTETPLYFDTPTPWPTFSPEDSVPTGLLLPDYVYSDGTSIIVGPVAPDGVMFDLNGSDVFELCLTRGYECGEYEDIIPVRLVHIRAPEPGVECYGDMAELELAKLLLEGMPVDISTDPNLAEEDGDGILQAWVWNSEVLVNLEMVKRGAAIPAIPKGSNGAFDAELRAAAEAARAQRIGLWGQCP